MRQFNRKHAAVLLVLALLLLTGLALASGEMLSRNLVSSGGDSLVEGDLLLRSAVGQPAAGTVSAGPTLCSGYLCGPGVGASGSPLFLPILIK